MDMQTLQSPWDWTAGKLLVEEAGGVVLFYEMKKTDNDKFGDLRPIDQLNVKHYNASNR